MKISVSLDVDDVVWIEYSRIRNRHLHLGYTLERKIWFHKIAKSIQSKLMCTTWYSDAEWPFWLGECYLDDGWNVLFRAFYFALFMANRKQMTEKRNVFVVSLPIYDVSPSTNKGSIIRLCMAGERKSIKDKVNFSMENSIKREWMYEYTKLEEAIG